MHENWWTRFAIGLCEDFPSFNADDRQAIKRNSPAVDKFCQGVYIGPGSDQSLVKCMTVSLNIF